MTENIPRKLSEICMSNNMCFSQCLLGNYYCSIGQAGHDVNCEYFGKKDENGINECLFYKKTEETVDLN